MASEKSANVGAAPAPAFPFTALHGHQLLQTALLLSAIDPLIGGVLIEGPRGTAKTTSARALAALLPDNDGRVAPFINLPLGCSEEQLAGALDLDAVLADGRIRFRPGLLADADGGVLYVDEVNLLADKLVDLLLDVCASGVNRIERDGISHQHPARLSLIGTMNPEEGELRPQLLDRFGLFVRLSSPQDASERQAIVRARLAFDADPAAFVARHQPAVDALRAQLVAARRRLPSIPFDDASHAQIAELCHAARPEGVRADLVMLRAARAHAALHGRDEIERTDIDRVSELVLAHRRQQSELPAADQPPPPADPADEAADRPWPGAENTDAEANDNTAPSSWGELPPPATPPIAALKPLRPLTAKKP